MGQEHTTRVGKFMTQCQKPCIPVQCNDRDLFHDFPGGCTRLFARQWYQILALASVADADPLIRAGRKMCLPWEVDNFEPCHIKGDDGMEHHYQTMWHRMVLFTTKQDKCNGDV